jgi:hypothetical protein
MAKANKAANLKSEQAETPGKKPGSQLSLFNLVTGTPPPKPSDYQEPKRQSNLQSVKTADGSSIKVVPLFKPGKNITNIYNETIYGSGTLRRIINSQVRMVSGERLNLYVNDKLIDDKELEQGPLRNFFLGAPGQPGLVSTWGSFILEYISYGNACGFLWENAGEFYFEKMPIEDSRLVDGEPMVYYKKDLDKGQNKNPAIVSPLYPMVYESNNVNLTAFWSKQEAAGYDVYGLPDWIGALYAAILEYMSLRYNVGIFKNGHLMKGLLTIIGMIEDESERAKIANSLKSGLQDDGFFNQILIHFAATKESAPEFKEMGQSSNDGEFTKLIDIVQRLIINHAGWYPSLCAQILPGSLGNMQQMKNESKAAKFLFVDPLQVKLTREILNPLAFEVSNRLGQDIRFEIQEVSIPVDIDKDVASDQERRIESGLPENAPDDHTFNHRTTRNVQQMPNPS